MRLACAVLLALVALVCAQTTTTGSSSSDRYLAVITVKGCPEWQSLLNRAALAVNEPSQNVILYSYLGCNARAEDNIGKLQFYIVNDADGSKAKTAAKALKKEPGVEGTTVIKAPSNVPPPFVPPTAPKKKDNRSRNIALICVFTIIPGIIILAVIYFVFFKDGGSSGGGNPESGGGDNYSKM